MSGDRDEGEEVERPSKSRRKQEMLDLQALGEELAALREDQLVGLKLPENLLDALLEYRRTPTHGGRRRQMQYVGKLMRGVEAEPIRAALSALTHDRREDTAVLHQAEEWRTRLLESDEALGEFAALHPDTDLRKLRSLTGVARTPGPEATVRRARRDLFRFIRAQLIAATDGPDGSRDPTPSPRSE